MLLAIYAAWLFHDLPDASELAEYRPPTATRVFAWDGTLIGEFSDERRVFVPYEEIPPVVVQAFLAAEDRNFFRHGGVDVGGLGRAMAKNVLNVLRGRRLEGGSTITQQVAKNVLLSNDATLGRKLREAILASRLEATLDKEHILELYLNEIFLGYRSYGVGVAAYNYFGKSLNQLTPDEAAFLAALPKGPNNYHPRRHPAAAQGRRDWVLGQMEQAGWLTREQAEAARARPLVTRDAPQRSAYRDADFFVEETRRQARNLFGERVNRDGLYIRTTLDPELQSAARDALMRGLETYDRRHGWRGAWGNISPSADWRAEAQRRSPPSERRAWRAAIVEHIDGNAARVRTAREDQTGLLEPADVAWARAGRGLSRGDLIFVEPAANGRFNLRQVPIVNGALVAIEPFSGRVVAMVGGYSYSLSNFNRATQARRQPGSAFKPFVYATALEGEFTPASIVVDGPISLPGARPGERWTPQNYNRDFYGPQPLRRGLEMSRNLMTVRLAQQIGMRQISADAVRFGVVDDMDPVLAMALGAGETTPFRLTAAYAQFANGGRRITPHLIELVQDRQGRVEWRADQRPCRVCRRPYDGSASPRLPQLGQQVIDPITAYQITSMLEGVVQRGTATAARSLGRPIAGKTGTTNDYRSAWFVGYSPDLVVGVFVGFDDNRSLGNGETGSTAAVPIFVDFMEDALRDRPVREFRRPSNAVMINVRGIEEAFRPGTERRAQAPVAEAGPAPSGPQPYDQVWRDGQVTGADNAGAAAAPRPPAREEPPEDLSGLY
ncbi:penicillin-binding protein 1A [Brevundimonas sp. 2R-24]|uniref:Penicillin-binding protein 1A n=2 Tax=Peiella sedimenti TaxID=3061083 RepID=A0ABT8SJ98_9CAUL|nr:penicillin-binding protein 1A [Caulobacteraceae bacterium XZ-24]